MNFPHGGSAIAAGVDESLSPFKEFKKTLYSILFLVIITPQIASADLDQAVRTSRSRTSRTERVERSRRREE